MIELIANGIQTVKPGGVILFTDAIEINNTAIMHREGSGTATIMNPIRGCACNRGGMRGAVATFGANIALPTAPPTGETAATAPLSLAIAVGGEPDTSTEMLASPATADTFVNVNRTAIIAVPGGCCTQVAIENTSGGTISVENARLILDI